MSEQNYPSEDLPVEPYAGGPGSGGPDQLNFQPQINYYFRLAHDPTKFLFLSQETTSPAQANLIFSTEYNSAQDARFRFRIVSMNASQQTFGIQTTLFNPRQALSVELATRRVISVPTNAAVHYRLPEVREGIYYLEQSGNHGFIGVPGAVSTNNTQVVMRPNLTPLEREWIITTNPLAPIPPLRPIEEGIYTIHTTRLPSSAIETPQSINQESEPFIRKFDGNFHQLWQFVYDNSLNAYQIINYTDQCLFAYDSGIPGTPPRQRYRLRFTSRLNQTDASYFYVNPADDGSYTLVSVKYPDQKFDLTLGITTDFNRVQLYQQNDYEAQNWLLKRVV